MVLGLCVGGRDAWRDALLDLLVDAAEDCAIFAVDADGRVIHWNAGATRIFGYSAAEVVGHSSDVLHNPEDLQAGIPDRDLDLAAETGRADAERWYARKDGSRFWAFASIMPVRSADGVLRGFATVLRDHASEEQRNLFLATLAHELRNPLGVLVHAVHLLHRHGEGQPEVEWLAGMIERQTIQLRRLVDDLLDLTRMSRGKLELHTQRVELRLVLAEAVETTGPLIEERRHRLHVVSPREPVELEADPDRLRQVFINLLTNAAKYMDPGGDITLAVELDEADAVVRVSDTGVGIPPERMATIFEPFAQGHPALHQSHSGLGIGLPLVRQLVALHGGTVEGQSGGAGNGSVFTVRLPLAR